MEEDLVADIEAQHQIALTQEANCSSLVDLFANIKPFGNNADPVDTAGGE